MADSTNIKFYKSASGGLGGAIDTGAQIPTAKFNNLFPVLSAADRLTGKDRYLCFYIKNTSSEKVNQFFFWLTSVKNGTATTWKFARGPAGKNGTESTIADINTEPAGVTWRTLGAKPAVGNPFVASLSAGDILGVWVWHHADAVAATEQNFTVKNDNCIFNYTFDITQAGTGGTGTPGGGGSGGSGGGTGGNPPPTPTNWKIAIVGDEGCGSTTNKVRDLCKTYDYTVSVGDHAYAAASCWTDTFKTLKPNFNSAYGNHEYSESGGIAPYKSFFGHNKTYFSFDFQNVHFIIIDSNINMDAGSAQHNFVTADLNFTDSSSNIDWIIAIDHHPWFGSSSKHAYNNGQVVQAFHSLFMSHSVAFVVTGHNHNWQRTHQVAYNSGSPTSPTVADGTAPYVKSTGGLIHIISGTGGHDTGGGLYSLSSQPAFQAYQNRTHNGIWEIVASSNGQTLTCSFVDIDGSKFDTFVITTS